jgi:hypothetical protein
MVIVGLGGIIWHYEALTIEVYISVLWCAFIFAMLSISEKG